MLLLKCCQLTTIEWKDERSLHTCALTNTQSLKPAFLPSSHIADATVGNQCAGPMARIATATHLIRGIVAL